MTGSIDDPVICGYDPGARVFRSDGGEPRQDGPQAAVSRW